ncbi:hypothetical protein H5410_040995 [Solanum commersonii]|uniref:Uncharacterized protein n=1 Tax=Solanum commersonii TaxID=4109 RepID=A0A9J5XQJ7_SOLCO|nr:hypothetical protein H5410_040995 [Solanum commersonii]
MGSSNKHYLPSPIEWRVGQVQIEEATRCRGTCGVMMNFDSDGIEEYNELVAALDKHEYGPNQRSMS